MVGRYDVTREMAGILEFVWFVHREVPDQDLSDLISQDQHLMSIVQAEPDKPDITVRHLQSLCVHRCVGVCVGERGRGGEGGLDKA